MNANNNSETGATPEIKRAMNSLWDNLREIGGRFARVQQANEELKNRIDSYTKEFAQKEQQISEIHNRIIALEDENSKNSELADIYLQERNMLREKTERFDEIMADYEFVKSENAELKEKSIELEAKLGLIPELEERMNELRESIDTLENDKTFLSVQVEELGKGQTDFSYARQELARKNHELYVRDDEISRLRETISTQESRILDLETRLLQSQESLEDFKKKIDEIADDLALRDIVIQEKENEILLYRSDLTSAEKQLAINSTIQKKYNELSIERTDLLRKITALEASLLDAQNAFLLAEEENRNQASEIAGKDIAIENANSEIAHLKMEMRSSGHESDRLVAIIDSKDRDLAKQNEDIFHLQEELLLFRRNVEDLERELGEIKSTASETETNREAADEARNSELAHLEELLKEKQNELNAAMAEISSLRIALRDKANEAMLQAEAEMNRLRGELDEKDKQIQKLQADLETAEAAASEIHELKDELERSRAEVDQMGTRMASLSGELAEARRGADSGREMSAEIESLKEELAVREEEIKSRNEKARQMLERIESLEASIKELDAETLARHADEESLRTALNEANREAERLHGEINSMRSMSLEQVREIENLSETINKYKLECELSAVKVSELASWRSANELILKEKDDRIRQLALTVSEAHQAEENAKVANNRLIDAQEEIDRLHSALESATEEIGHAKEAQSAKQTEVSELAEGLKRELLAAHSELQVAQRALEAAGQSRDEAKAQYESEIRRVRSELHLAKDQNERIIAEREALVDEFGRSRVSLERELAKLAEESAAKAEEASAQAAQIEALRNELKQKEENTAVLIHQIEEQKADDEQLAEDNSGEIAVLKSEISVMAAEIESLKKELEEASKGKADKKANSERLAAAEAECKELRKQAKQAEKERAALETKLEDVKRRTDLSNTLFAFAEMPEGRNKEQKQALIERIEKLLSAFN